MLKKILPLAGALAVMIAACSSAFAQASASASAFFGSFYTAANPGGHNVSIIVGNSVGVFSLQSSSASCNTSVGDIVMPSQWQNYTGHATQMATVGFSPTMVNGSFSGTCVGKYTNSYSSGPSTLTLSVNYSGYSEVPVSQAAPSYQVLSVLYSPPGNASTAGFSNTASTGASTSIANDFSTQDSISFKAGFLGSSNSVTFTVGASSTLTNGYNVTYQATSGTQLGSVKQAIDHTQDQVYLWINPTVTLTQTGSTTGYYSMGTIDNSGNFNNNAPMDIVNVNIAGLLNPALIPLAVLEPQVVTPTITLPGLASVCAHPVACTATNACGCVPSDFTAAVQQDEMYSVASQTTTPSSIDPNRYVYVNFVTLEGPEQQGAGPVKNTFALTDSNVTSSSLGIGESYGVSYTHTWSTPSTDAIPTLGISTSNSFTYKHTETDGISNGTAHTGTVTMGSSNVGCSENVDVYEDTVYHTFLYALPAAPVQACI